MLNLLSDAGCTEDEIRLVRLLLSNTKLRVRVDKSTSDVFISIAGAFQGDSLSGILFTLTLAGALMHLRAVLERPNPPFSPECMPLESEYADDVDFLGEDEDELKGFLPVATSVLDKWSLRVNEQKTYVFEIVNIINLISSRPIPSAEISDKTLAGNLF